MANIFDGKFGSVGIVVNYIQLCNVNQQVCTLFKFMF